MTAQERLRLNGGSVFVNFQSRPPKSPSDIVRDIQIIHDRKVSRTVMWKRRQMAGGTLGLEAHRHGIAFALFEADVAILPEVERVTAVLQNPERANQAAGWAALQLYGELSEGRPLIEQMYAVDPSIDPVRRQRPETSGAGQAVLEGKKPGLIPLNDDNPEVFTLFDARTYDGTVHGTYVAFNNDRQLSLPDILWRIKENYDDIYPAAHFPSRNHSELVAGIVGAENLESFQDAWDTAIELRSDKPVDAANILLTSGTFTATWPEPSAP